MINSFLCTLLSVLLPMLSYTVELPFSSVDLPNETTLSHYGQELSLHFTMSEQQLNDYPDEYSLLSELEQRFSSAGVTFASPMLSEYPYDSYSQGKLDILFSTNSGLDERRIFFHTDSGSRQVTQTCLGPEQVTLSVSSSAPLFPSSADTRSFSMSGGVSGKTYILSCSGTSVGTVTCGSSGTASFGSFSTPGTYVVKRQEGYQVSNYVTLTQYGVFVPGNHEIYGDSYSSVGADGGLASMHASVGTSMDASHIQSLQNWYNNRQQDIDFWPDLGQQLTISFDDAAGEMEVHLMCPPNFDAAARTFDTRMKLYSDPDMTLAFVQPGGGSLVDYGVEKSDGSGGGFSIVLSGSQFKVTYDLMLNGSFVRSMKGTGYPIAFHSLSASGVYSVRASYQGRTLLLSDTVTASVPDEAGGANYIAVSTYTGDGTARYTDVTYYGGLGYPVQEVSSEYVFPGRNLIRPITYDQMRREDVVFLPYAADALNSRYIQDTFGDRRAFHESMYPGEGQHAFSHRAYESGHSGRLLSERREGSAYVMAGRSRNYTHRLCASGDGVMKLRYVYPSGTSAAAVVNEGTYDDGHLKVTLTVSEDRDTSLLFTTASGRTVLSRMISQGTNHDTYYVHDLRDSLVCVIPPMGTPMVGSGFAFDSQLAKDYCFTYSYDAFGNMIERHVPGAGVEVMAYDLAGRVAAYADAQMREAGLYRYTVYDSMGRVTEEGYASSGMSPQQIRSELRKENAQIKSILLQTTPLRVCEYYSGSVLPGGFVPESGVAESGDVTASGCRTLLKKERIYEDPYIDGTSCVSSATWRERTYFYDPKGRLVQTVETGSDGWTSRYSVKYDFTGNVLASAERHSDGTGEDHALTTYEYDSRGRVLTCGRRVNGQELATLVYSYDDLGRMAAKTVQGRVTEEYSYNMHGWRIGQQVTLYGTPQVFEQELRHYDPQSESTQPRYGGYVSESEDAHYGRAARVTAYGYDRIGRMTEAVRTDGTSESASYDLNGNVLTLNGLSFSHQGNRMTGAQDVSADVDAQFTWWSDGCMKHDSEKNLQFCYNFSNLPSALFVGGTGGTPAARVVYLADGTKVSSLGSDAAGLVYRGSFVYRKTADGAQSVESVAHDEGRMLAVQGASGTEFIDTWHVRDYLGSVRAVYDITQEAEDVTDVASVILEQNDYYAFGGRIEDPTQPIDQENRYRFNGKEQLRFDGIGLDPNLTDYGARYYESRYARWTTPDPLADKYYSTSPYAFCNNNPVNFVDPDGRYLETIWDVVSISIGVKNLRENIKAGNVKAAIGDGVGILIDGLAAAFPVVPGGIGAARTAGKAAINAAEGAIDAAKAVDTANDAKTVSSINDVTKSTETVSPTIRGIMNEERVLNDLGLTKNTKTVQGKTKTGESRNTIPDAITADTVYEVKDVQTLSNTKQIQAQINYAKEKGLDYKIITGTRTHISKNIPEKYIIRLDYIGPQR